MFVSSEKLVPSGGSIQHCDIHGPISVVFVIIMTFFPLLVTTCVLIPTYLNVYSYQKAIMGPDEDESGGHHHLDDHSHSHVASHDTSDDDATYDTSHSASSHGADEGGVNSSEHIDAHHADHQQNHGHGNCLIDTLIGKDTTSFE